MDGPRIRQKKKMFDCVVLFRGFSATSFYGLATHVRMSHSFLNQVATQSEMPKHKEIENYKSIT